MNINSHIKNFTRRPFIQNSARLISGNLVGQAISLLFYLLLCRIYSPEDFGVFATFMGYAGCLGIISTASYHYAIVLPDDNETVDALVQLCAICVTVVSLLTLLAIIPANLFIFPQLYDNTKLGIFWFMPLYVFFYGIWATVEFWNIRQSNYKLLSTYQINQNLSSSVAKVLLYKLRNGFGLVIGTIIGQVIALASALVKKPTPLRMMLKRKQRYMIKKAAKRYKSFPAFSLPRNTIKYVSSNSVYMMLAPVFGTYELGLFLMAATLSQRPLMLVNNAIDHNIMQTLADKLKAGLPLAPSIKKYVKCSVLVMVSAFILLGFIVKPLCVFLLGPEWEMSGVYLQYMLPWLCASAIFSPLSSVPDLLMAQRADMFFETANILIRIAMLAIGIAALNFNVAIIAYCAGSFVVTVAHGIWCVYLICRYDKKTASTHND